MKLTDMLLGYDPAKPRWTIAADYHPHILSVSRYVNRHDARFTAFDKVRRSNGIRLPDRRI